MNAEERRLKLHERILERYKLIAAKKQRKADERQQHLERLAQKEEEHGEN